MKSSLLVAALLISAASVAAPPGGAPGGGMGGGPPTGQAMGMGHSAMGPQNGMSNSMARPEQEPLRDAQINGGAFRMLEQKTGMTSDQLKTLYASSGARNFGAFVSALVVSKNLGLDSTKVLDGLRTQSLGKTLTSLGVEPAKAKDEIRRATQEVKAAG